jgi:phage virion morphogenesis protein
MAVTLTTEGMEAALDGLQRLAGFDAAQVLDEVGAIVEDSTKVRIADEKTAPDGTPWADWSADYAATRRAQHSLLVASGNPGLLESIQRYASPTEVEIGSNMIYAAVHQFGAAQGAFGNTSRGSPIPFGDIPARPYLGLSDDDRQEIEAFVSDRLGDLLQ